MMIVNLDMKAVSGRMTLKKTSLAWCSVFSTVLVTRVDAYLNHYNYCFCLIHSLMLTINLLTLVIMISVYNVRG